MMFLRPPTTPGKRSGKQIRGGFGPGGSTRDLFEDASSNEALRLPRTVVFGNFWAGPMPAAAADPLQYAFCCFPASPRFPSFEDRDGEAKTAPKGRS